MAPSVVGTVCNVVVIVIVIVIVFVVVIVTWLGEQLTSPCDLRI